MPDSRLTDLETTVTFQERLLQELSDVIHHQQQELDLLKVQLEQFAQQQKNRQQQGETPRTPESERPPHY